VNANIRVVRPAAAEVQVDHHLLGAAIQTQVRGTAAGAVACHRCCRLLVPLMSCWQSMLLCCVAGVGWRCGHEWGRNVCHAPQHASLLMSPCMVALLGVLRRRWRGCLRCHEMTSTTCR
jgi:hypothetical protein